MELSSLNTNILRITFSFIRTVKFYVKYDRICSIIILKQVQQELYLKAILQIMYHSVFILNH